MDNQIRNYFVTYRASGDGECWQNKKRELHVGGFENKSRMIDVSLARAKQLLEREHNTSYIDVFAVRRLPDFYCAI